MNRKIHRWVSLVFVVCVVVNVAVNALGLTDLAMIVGPATLLPLFVLIATGSVMFVQPYLKRIPGSEA